MELSPLFTLAFVIYFIRANRMEENTDTNKIAIQVLIWIIAICGTAIASAYLGCPPGLSLVRTCAAVGYRLLIQLRIDAGIVLATLVAYAVFLERKTNHR